MAKRHGSNAGSSRTIDVKELPPRRGRFALCVVSFGRTAAVLRAVWLLRAHGRHPGPSDRRVQTNHAEGHEGPTPVAPLSLAGEAA